MIETELQTFFAPFADDKDKDTVRVEVKGERTYAFVDMWTRQAAKRVLDAALQYDRHMMLLNGVRIKVTPSRTKFR